MVGRGDCRIAGMIRSVMRKKIEAREGAPRVHVGRLFLLAALFSGAATLSATDVLMEGVDTERTGWVKDEKIFTLANVGSTKLLWKVKLDSAPRAMHNLFAPLIAERVETPQGVREIGVVAGISDDVFGIDVATGKQLWHRH